MDLKKVWNCGFSNKKVNEFGQSTPLCVARISISKVKSGVDKDKGTQKIEMVYRQILFVALFETDPYIFQALQQ